MKHKSPTVFCPACLPCYKSPQTSGVNPEYTPPDGGLAKFTRAPVNAPMGVLFVEGDKPATVQPFSAPHFTYVCTRCGFAEIHERLVDAA